MSSFDKVLLRVALVAVIVGVVYYLVGAPPLGELFNKGKETVERTVNDGWTSEEERGVVAEYVSRGAAQDDAECLVTYFKNEGYTYAELVADEDLYDSVAEAGSETCGF